jgi:hypothetical protein
MKEFRRTVRHKFELDLMILLPGQEEQNAKGVNISEYGISCRVSREIKPLVKLGLKFTLPLGYDDMELSIQGIVIWCSKLPQGHILGLEFYLISEEQREFIRKFVQNL